MQNSRLEALEAVAKAAKAYVSSPAADSGEAYCHLVDALKILDTLPPSQGAGEGVRS